MKMILSLLTLLIPITHATYHASPGPKIPTPDNSSPQNRSDQSDPPEDPTSGPSAISIDLPTQFLPPPWSPYSGLDSPYPSTGVSPWDDSGRSQMVDNEASTWRTCPRLHLDCRKCPRDYRCRRASGNMGSSSGGSTSLPEDSGQASCPLSKCDSGSSGKCGSNARCTRGYCVCDLGTKGPLGNTEGYRGNEGLGKLTVYVDVRVDCSAKCDDLSCKEVKQVDDGMCWRSGSGSGVQLVDMDVDMDMDMAGVEAGLGGNPDFRADGQIS